MSSFPFGRPCCIAILCGPYDGLLNSARLIDGDESCLPGLPDSLILMDG